jgi:alpha-L-fucosidase
VLDFKKEIAFDRAMFQENIAEGQRNVAALLEYWDGKGWQKADQFTTIGYKRLLRLPLIKTSKVRLTVLEAKLPVQLSEIGFYKASAKE